MSRVLLEDHKLTRTVFTAIPLSSPPNRRARPRWFYSLTAADSLTYKNTWSAAAKTPRRKRTGRIHTEANSNKLRKTCPISTISFAGVSLHGSLRPTRKPADISFSTSKGQMCTCELRRCSESLRADVQRL